MVGHSFQVCLKFSISFRLPFNAKKYFLAFEMGMNVFIFPLFSQYSGFLYSLHCVHCAVHFYIADQSLFLFSHLFFLCLVCNEQSLSLRAPEGSVVLKALVLLALPGYFLGNRRLNVIYWMLFTNLLEWLKSQFTSALDTHTLWLGSLQQTN